MPFTRKLAPQLAAAALIIGVVSGVYAKSLSYPFLNWDDNRYITENSDIRTLSGYNLKKVFSSQYAGVYVPLTMLSFTVDYQFHHMNPRGYRWTNLVLHLANCLMVYAAVGWISGEWLAALGAALIFGVHPVQPESVVWISQRKNVLSNFFFFGGLLSHLYARARPQREKVCLALTQAFFFLACFAKALMVVMPALLIAYDFCYGHFKWKEWKRYIPYAAGAVLFSLVAWSVVTRLQSQAQGTLFSQVLMCVVVLSKYLELLFIPARQSILYAFPAYQSVAHPDVLAALAVLLPAFGLTVWLFLRDRKLFFWAAWYFIFIFPAANFFLPARTLMQDRWLYTSVAGAFALVFLGISRWAGKAALAGVIIVSVLGYGWLCVKREAVWSSSERLWLDTAARIGAHHES